MRAPTASQQQALAGMVVSLQCMAECNEALSAIIKKRTPYLMAVHAALPEHKVLLQGVLNDFDRQMIPAVVEYKRKMRGALQDVVAYAPELLKFFE